ncbi:cytochrome P450 1B1 [Mastacembelus armatus]|uniref:Cytochrome P450 1A n=1 Tax=Mastacembelus armatus TaxID=205130 RepID=A0A3Q3MEN3_9TELE|nr:cytochrome P450 1B1-like [Mastacembelus armatus]XP_026165511.1 cytochrome P450 1B1-like [Mastacembelus armatus]XP_026165512.1 cytochrome P450 1B1-like [Mastacembelus armatus]XP_026165513.1 cytochrome P450 1B1-like [Mastacembelus armatus]XP_026165514.1 cytochrome P450 1B1-like [Mastacembelus armatus]
MDVPLEGINTANARALLLTCVTLLFSLHLWRWFRQRSIPSPPGPFAWPIVGNAAQLGNAPHLYFSRMAEKYGNVFQIKLGSRTVVVLNGDAIKQALVKQGTDFAGRPDFTSFQYVSEGKSMAFGTTSEWWKAQRKVAHSTVRMFSTGDARTKKTFEHHVICEVRELLRLFVEKTKEEKYFQPLDYLVVSIANIMSAVCFGKRYSYEDEEFRQVIGRNDQFTQTVGAGSIVDVMPWLQYFPNPVKTIFDNFKRLNLEFGMFIRNKVIEHRKTIQSNTIRDMTDALIVALEQMRGKTELSLGKDYAPPILGDIFGASQDTLSTALQWIVLILVKYPELQLRLQREVDKVVDRSQLPSIEDQVRLPYVMAFIYEVMRFTSFVPLTIPHSTTTDTSIMGYTIPKNTVVFINQWSINHNPSIWSHPETFDPERFLDQNGALNKDLTSSVLIFSLGKRRCIGEELSKMQLFLFTALITHQCHITPDPARPPKLGYNYGLTLKPHTYVIAVSLRDNMAALDAAAKQLPAEQVESKPSTDTDKQ